MKKRKLCITALFAAVIACFVCFGVTLASAEPGKGNVRVQIRSVRAV